MKSLFRFTSAAVAAPMKKPSAIWMKDSAILPLTRASARRSRICPPLIATISPLRMARRANRPRPSMGLGRIAVFGER